jgi:hypothetical protein
MLRQQAETIADPVNYAMAISTLPLSRATNNQISSS